LRRGRAGRGRRRGGRRTGGVVPGTRPELQQSQVGLGIDADHVGLDQLAVAQHAVHLHGLLGDVIVGDHVTVGADDDARSPHFLPLPLAVAVLLLDGLDEDQGGVDPLLGVLDHGRKIDRAGVLVGLLASGQAQA
jgi:hypothetical protein